MPSPNLYTLKRYLRSWHFVPTPQVHCCPTFPFAHIKKALLFQYIIDFCRVGTRTLRRFLSIIRAPGVPPAHGDILFENCYITSLHSSLLTLQKTCYNPRSILKPPYFLIGTCKTFNTNWRRAMNLKSFFFLQVISVCLLVAFGTSCASKKSPETTPTEPTLSQKKSKSHKKKSATSQQTTSSPSKMGVMEAVMATAVEDLNPQGTSGTFNTSVQKLYCFTKIQGAPEETYIHHVWLHNGTEMANVKLRVKGNGYRTYSSKIIESHRTGSWKVKITDEGGNLLTEVPFEITATQVSQNQ